jgi:hypothetical protein
MWKEHDGGQGSKAAFDIITDGVVVVFVRKRQGDVDAEVLNRLGRLHKMKWNTIKLRIFPAQGCGTRTVQQGGRCISHVLSGSVTLVNECGRKALRQVAG